MFKITYTLRFLIKGDYTVMLMNENNEDNVIFLLFIYYYCYLF